VTHLPILVIIVPLVYAFLVPLLDLVSSRLRTSAAAAVAVTHLVFSIALFIHVFQNGTLEYQLGGWDSEVGIILYIDGLAATFAVMIALGTALVAWYSLDFVREGESKYFLLLYIASAGLSGAVLTGDLFNLYVFIEIIALSGFALVAFRRGFRALMAAMRYMIFTILSSMLILLAIAFVYATMGTLNLGEIAASMHQFDPTVLKVSAGMFLVGVALKLAIVPLHGWLPATYGESSTPVGALLAGVGHKVPLYILIRFLYFFEAAAGEQRLATILLGIGAVTIAFGHFMALGQPDIRRVLGFSSIAHTGYMLVGLGIGTPFALVAVLFHAMNHLIVKLSAFFSVGMLTRGDRERATVLDLQGRGAASPFAGMAFLVSTLALIGIPPLGAFASKWALIMAAIRADHIGFALLMIAGTVVAAVYYGRIGKTLYISTDDLKPDRSWTAEGVLYGSAAVVCAVAFSFALFPAANRILDELMVFII